MARKFRLPSTGSDNLSSSLPPQPPSTPRRSQEDPDSPLERDQLSPLPAQRRRSSASSSGNNSLCTSFNFNGARPRSSPFRRRASSTTTSSSSSSAEEAQLRRRRVDSLNLETPYHFDYDPMTNRYQQMPEAFIEGQELYLHFFHEQVRNAGLGDLGLEEELDLTGYHVQEVHSRSEGDGPLQARRPRAMSMNLQNFHDPVWRQTGRELQALADAFAHSPGRALVRQQAEQVDIRSLDMEKFWALLKGLFENGQITRERILVLFFFCSDVAILAIRQRASSLVAQLTKWSLDFIRQQICSWVQEHGGWSAVLHSGLNVMQQTAVIGTCVAVFVCCMIYIRKNW